MYVHYGFTFLMFVPKVEGTGDVTIEGTTIHIRDQKDNESFDYDNWNYKRQSDKQRIAALEREVAELKASKKDE